MEPSEIVRRLWNICSVLRDEGVTYHEYLNELTLPLFLKRHAPMKLQGGSAKPCGVSYD